MTTKKNLQEQVRVLQKELSSFKAEQKKQREKPLYVVYPEHDYCERWYEENRKDIQAFHEDENNFIEDSKFCNSFFASSSLYG